MNIMQEAIRIFPRPPVRMIGFGQVAFKLKDTSVLYSRGLPGFNRLFAVSKIPGRLNLRGRLAFIGLALYVTMRATVSGGRGVFLR